MNLDPNLSYTLEEVLLLGVRPLRSLAEAIDYELANSEGCDKDDGVTKALDFTVILSDRLEELQKVLENMCRKSPEEVRPSEVRLSMRELFQELERVLQDRRRCTHDRA